MGMYSSGQMKLEKSFFRGTERLLEKEQPKRQRTMC